MREPCDRVVVTAEDGARVTVCGHGGQLLGWTPAGAEADRLWTSPLARCGPGLALRGGVPVIFPRFSDRELPGGPEVPRHGFARDRAWDVETGRAGDDEAAFVLATLTDDPATRSLWPHRFTLRVQVTATGRQLVMQVEVGNAGDAPFGFALALHTYLRVGDAAAARVHGLAGRTAVPNGTGPDAVLDDQVPALGPRDVTVPGVFRRTGSGPAAGADDVGTVRLTDPQLGISELWAEGFEDLVLWNPGPDHGLADVPPDGASSFVCLEPALLTPVTLAPGATWTGVQTLVAGAVPD